MKFGAKTTLILLLVMSIAGGAYMSLGILGVGPTKKFTRITLMLNTSGGLLQTSQVTMRGIKIGRVARVSTTPTGLAAALDIDSAYPVPANSTVAIENLSVAGEQYVDFTPEVIEPPYFTDNAVVPTEQIKTTVTVSQILTKANALLSALDPADLRTVISNASQAIAGNEAALDQLATDSELFANMVHENKRLLATLFSNLSTLTTGLGQLHAGEVFSQTGKLLPAAIPAFIELIGQFDALTKVGGEAFRPDRSVADLINKLSDYLDMLSVPLGTFATVLQPVTERLRPLKIDAGHWLDFWESTFNDHGAVRVNLAVPEWSKP